MLKLAVDFMKEGVIEYLVKPVEKEKLIESVTKAFRAVLEYGMAPEEANAVIVGEAGGMPLANGYFHGKAGAAFEDGSAGGIDLVAGAV